MNEVPLEELYADLVLAGTTEEPALTLALVTALNGVAAGPDGRSGSLGGEADRVAIQRIRDASDVVLAGGSTVRQEGYGPIRSDDARAARRAAKGLTPMPRLAVLTNAGVDTDRLAGDGPDPILVTTNRDLVGTPGATVLVRDEPLLTADVLAALHEQGFARVLCEGGPRLARQFLDAGLVDELFLTIASTIAGGQPRLLPDPLPHLAFEVVSVARHRDDILVRSRRR